MRLSSSWKWVCVCSVAQLFRVLHTLCTLTREAHARPLMVRSGPVLAVWFMLWIRLVHRTHTLLIATHHDRSSPENAWWFRMVLCIRPRSHPSLVSVWARPAAYRPRAFHRTNTMRPQSAVDSCSKVLVAAFSCSSIRAFVSFRFGLPDRARIYRSSLFFFLFYLL